MQHTDSLQQSLLPQEPHMVTPHETKNLSVRTRKEAARLSAYPVDRASYRKLLALAEYTRVLYFQVMTGKGCKTQLPCTGLINKKESTRSGQIQTRFASPTLKGNAPPVLFLVSVKPIFGRNKSTDLILQQFYNVVTWVHMKFKKIMHPASLRSSLTHR